MVKHRCNVFDRVIVKHCNKLGSTYTNVQVFPATSFTDTVG